MSLNTCNGAQLDSDEYLTFPQASKRFPAFTEGSLRWMRFTDTTGFNKCVRKIGRKLLISVRDFQDFLDSHVG